jgi:hypothetical protein
MYCDRDISEKFGDGLYSDEILKTHEIWSDNVWATPAILFLDARAPVPRKLREIRGR